MEPLNTQSGDAAAQPLMRGTPIGVPRRNLWIAIIGITASLLLSAATVTIIVAATSSSDADTKNTPFVLGELKFHSSLAR